jgi:hypothetical protein
VLSQSDDVEGRQLRLWGSGTPGPSHNDTLPRTSPLPATYALKRLPKDPHGLSCCGPPASIPLLPKRSPDHVARRPTIMHTRTSCSYDLSSVRAELRSPDE